MIEHAAQRKRRRPLRRISRRLAARHLHSLTISSADVRSDASSSELEDLAKGCPLLVDASNATTSGVRLMRFLGGGGMSAVFLAELEGGARSRELSPATPKRIAIQVHASGHGARPPEGECRPADDLREGSRGARRVMERKPPTEFVVGFYGSGRAAVSVAGGRRAAALARDQSDGMSTVARRDVADGAREPSPRGSRPDPRARAHPRDARGRPRPCTPRGSSTATSSRQRPRRRARGRRDAEARRLRHRAHRRECQE